MRIHLPVLIAAIAAAQPAAAATRNFGITSFDRIRVEGPYRVRLATGIAPFARASGAPAAIDRVAIEVQGRTLLVRTNASWGGYPGQEYGPVEISIGTHDLTSAWLNGSGSLQIDKVKGLSFTLSSQGSGIAQIGQAELDNLIVAVAGGASATVAGRVGKLNARVRGVSILDAAPLEAKDADLGTEGPATIKAHVTNAAKVNASGVATVTLTGERACALTVTGSASVSGCRARQ